MHDKHLIISETLRMMADEKVCLLMACRLQRSKKAFFFKPQSKLSFYITISQNAIRDCLMKDPQNMQLSVLKGSSWQRYALLHCLEAQDFCCMSPEAWKQWMMHNLRSWFNFLFVTMKTDYLKKKKKKSVFMFYQLTKETPWKNMVAR